MGGEGWVVGGTDGATANGGALENGCVSFLGWCALLDLGYSTHRQTFLHSIVHGFNHITFRFVIIASSLPHFYLLVI
jgi:hypothetical protein